MAEPSFSRDPLGLTEELREALGQKELAGLANAPASGGAPPEVRRACYHLAEALGKCRLFGVDPGDLDGVLPPEAALAAARELAQALPAWAVEARTLGDRLDRAEEPLEVEAACCELLETALETWAVFLAVDEAYRQALDEGVPEPTLLRDGIGRCLDALDEFDAALLAQRELLVPATDTELLSTWRALLAEGYRDSMPWWLDGTLEEIGRRLEEEAIASLPPPPRRVKPSEEWVWLPAEPELALAADTPAAPPALSARWWRAPGGGHLACLIAIPGGTEMRVAFLTRQEPALDLAGASAVLGGVPGLIDPEGAAAFPRHHLWAAARAGLRPVLLVAGEEWEGPFMECPE